MPMTDWIHKYPRVAALLQQDGEDLDQACAEDRPRAHALLPFDTWTAAVADGETAVQQAAYACVGWDRTAVQPLLPCGAFGSPINELAGWIGDVGQWKEACVRHYGPQITLFLFVEPDFYAHVRSLAFPHVTPGFPFWVDVERPGVTLWHADMRIILHGGCPPGTWFGHWSRHGAPSRVLAIGGRQFTHAITTRLAEQRDGTEEPFFLQTCDTPYPAPVCRCGAFLLEWNDACR